MAAYAPGNIIDAGGDKVSLPNLDAALAKVGAFRQSRNGPKLWLMGLQMKQIVDGLQTKIQIPLTSTVLNDGQIVMANYANSPIFETDFLVPESVSSSPSDLAGIVADSGTLGASFTYRIASVIVYGEQVAAASDAQDCAAGGKKVTSSWTADSNAKRITSSAKKCWCVETTQHHSRSDLLRRWYGQRLS